MLWPSSESPSNRISDPKGTDYASILPKFQPRSWESHVRITSKRSKNVGFSHVAIVPRMALLESIAEYKDWVNYPDSRVSARFCSSDEFGWGGEPS